VNMPSVIRPLTTALLGVSVAALVSCGSSGTGLIPAASAGPLKADFEAVLQAAGAGNGECVATESALGKTEQDFLALPATVDSGLRSRLQQGIANLRRRALATCTQRTPTATTTTRTTTTTPTATTPATTTPTAPTTTTPATPTGTATTPTTPTNPNEGGGTAAPGEGEGEAGKGSDKGLGKSEREAEGNAGGDGGVGGANAGGGQ
jgi:hypothetical protein